MQHCKAMQQIPDVRHYSHVWSHPWVLLEKPPAEYIQPDTGGVQVYSCFYHVQCVSVIVTCAECITDGTVKVWVFLKKPQQQKAAWSLDFCLLLESSNHLWPFEPKYIYSNSFCRAVIGGYSLLYNDTVVESKQTNKKVAGSISKIMIQAKVMFWLYVDLF